MAASSSAAKAVSSAINASTASVASKNISLNSINTLKQSYMSNIELFTNYNFREYFKRKYNREFDNLLTNFNNQKDISTDYSKLTEELRMIKRQSIINQLYKFDELIVEDK
ncbi:hypothetical protein ACO0SA_001810 [Hanseniaspora valbyensis]